jgi:O-antigen/teichoic acid export membrane protein
VRLARNSIFLTVEKGAHLLGGMLLVVLVARILGRGVLAEYAYVIGLTAFFVPILDAGLNNRIIRSVARGGHGATEASREAVSYRITVAVPVLVLMVGCALISSETRTLVLAVFLIGGSTILMGLGDSFNSVIKGLQRAEISATLILGLNVILVVSSAWTMFAGMGLTAIGLCYFLSRGVYLVAGAGAVQIVAREHKVILRPGIRKDAVVDGIFHLPAVYFLGNLLHVNYITTYLAGDSLQADFYAVGYRVAAALFILTGASMEAVLPALTQRLRESRDLNETVKKLFWSHMLISVCLVVLVQGVAQPMIALILGDDFGMAEGPIRLLVLCVPVFTLCALAHTVLLACGQQKIATSCMVGLLGVGSLLGMGAEFIWGSNGTALASTLTACIFGIVLWELVRRHLRRG